MLEICPWCACLSSHSANNSGRRIGRCLSFSPDWRFWRARRLPLRSLATWVEQPRLDRRLEWNLCASEERLRTDGVRAQYDQHCGGPRGRWAGPRCSAPVTPASEHQIDGIPPKILQSDKGFDYADKRHRRILPRDAHIDAAMCGERACPVVHGVAGGGAAGEVPNVWEFAEVRGGVHWAGSCHGPVGVLLTGHFTGRLEPSTLNQHEPEVFLLILLFLLVNFSFFISFFLQVFSPLEIYLQK